jgi:predicted TIM-barrel fold metal-dependent hydrolase
LDWLWPAAEKAGLPMALLAGDWLPLLGQIAERHPGLKLMVDHMGALRGAKGDAAFPNMKELTALARYPNVAVKLTTERSLDLHPLLIGETFDVVKPAAADDADAMI